MAETSAAQFSAANAVTVADRTLFEFDEAENEKIMTERPWRSNPMFFKKVKISTVALVKMVQHTRSGEPLEVMGLLQGKVTRSGEFIILDCYALPVEGTETRVNAGNDPETNEFIVNYNDRYEQLGHKFACCGWYHSHPGYGCWLSGIDVGTQKQFQIINEPWVAIVVDPTRTLTAGKVDIGAFRTLPEGTRGDGASGVGNLPADKIEDFGAYADQYYKLDVEIIKSSGDDLVFSRLWNEFWRNTLAESRTRLSKDKRRSDVKNLCACGTRKGNAEGAIQVSGAGVADYAADVVRKLMFVSAQLGSTQPASESAAVDLNAHVSGFQQAVGAR